MQYPFYILRTIKHAINWFFEDEEERIYCRSSQELRDNLKKGDKIFALNLSGKYIQADSIEHAYDILGSNRNIYDLMEQRYNHPERSNEIIRRLMDDFMKEYA